MRIAIISTYETLRNAGNYGALFQNYALQCWLQARGHQTFWLRAVKRKRKRLHVFKLIATALKGVFGYAWHRDKKNWNSFIYSSSLLQNYLRPRKFDEFFKTLVPHTRREYYHHRIVDYPPAADVYIAGSDQIWNRMSPLYFLDFGPKSTKRVIFAASARWQHLPEQWISFVRERIQNIDAISVREVEGLEVCSRIGRNDAAHVLDPAMLLDKEHYLNIAQRKMPAGMRSEKYIFMYLLNLRSKNEFPWKAAKNFAEEADLDLFVDGLQGSQFFIGAGRVVRPTPYEWISACNESRYVITNSYHGTVFSIILNKPFLVVLQKENAENVRIESLLKLVRLQHRIVYFDSSEIGNAGLIDQTSIAEDIDWDAVNENVSRLRRQSEGFLIDAIERDE